MPDYRFIVTPEMWPLPGMGPPQLEYFNRSQGAGLQVHSIKKIAGLCTGQMLELTK